MAWTGNSLPAVAVDPGLACFTLLIEAMPQHAVARYNALPPKLGPDLRPEALELLN